MRPWLAVAPPLDPAAIPLGGQDWNQAEVLREVDGDTERLLRRRVIVLSEERDDQGPLVCTDVRVRVLEDDVTDFPTGLAGRLVNLDTPEKKDEGYAEATRDLDAFNELAGDRLRVITYDQGGGFDRLLVDPYYLDAAGVRHTATEWMLRRGWPIYRKGF